MEWWERSGKLCSIVSYIIVREFKARGEGVTGGYFLQLLVSSYISYSPAFLVAKRTSMNWKRIR